MNKLNSQNQLFRLIASSFWETVREPAVLFWGIIFPILMALGLGVAFTKKTDISRKIAVIDHSNSNALDTSTFMGKFLFKNTKSLKFKENQPLSSTLTIADNKTGNKTFIFLKTTYPEAIVLLKRGTVSLIVDEKDDKPVYHFDPSNSEAQLSFLILSDVFNGKIKQFEANAEQIQPLTVSGTRYIDFLIPGLLAMGIMSSCLWGLSYGMIEKRSKKLLRRMVATPMKKSYFLISLISVRTAMNFIEGFLLFAFAYLVFGFKLQGSLTALLLLLLAGNIAFAGVSVLISSRTSSSEVGNGLINVVSMPMMVLSGIFFSYHNFPEWSIPIIQKLPLTMMTDGLRSVFTEGAGLAETMFNILILTAIGIVCFIAGLKIFKWH